MKRTRQKRTDVRGKGASESNGERAIERVIPKSFVLKKIHLIDTKVTDGKRRGGEMQRSCEVPHRRRENHLVN